MSAECQLYGKISGAHGGTDNWWDLYELNRNVINQLPENDEYPPLIKDMFKVPSKTDRNNPILYREQIIHFGGSFNHFDAEMECGDKKVYEVWLSKFEGLLKKLYWFDTIVHIYMEMYGRYEYRWVATQEVILDIKEKKPKPINAWEFKKVNRDGF